MKLLCVGDVVGEPGLRFLCRRLPALRRRLSVDVCIVNGENAHPDGVGITRSIAEELFAHGADAVTTGNHALRRAPRACMRRPRRCSARQTCPISSRRPGG